MTTPSPMQVDPRRGPEPESAGNTPGPGWQALIPALALGIWSLEEPVAAGCCLIGLWLGLRLALGRGPRIPVYVLVFVLGSALAHWRMPTVPEDVPPFMAVREKVLVSATVDEVRSRENMRLVMVLGDVSVISEQGGRELPGSLVWTWQEPGFRPDVGARVSFRARLKPVRGFANPGAWDTAGYWRRQGVFWRTFARGATFRVHMEKPPPGGLESWRTRLRDGLDANAPCGTGGALLASLLLGERFLLDSDVRDLLAAAGLAHTLALSGLHLGIVASFGIAVAYIVGFLFPNVHLVLPRPKLAVLLAAPLVVGYVWLGGATPSLLRSGLMFASFGFMVLLDRGRVLLDGLFLAVGIILLFDPLSLFEVGLQLSVAAVAGIGLLLPHLRAVLRGFAPEPSAGGLRKWGWRMARPPAMVLAVSLAATAGVFPVGLNAFGEMSPSLWTNALWLPLLGVVVMPAGFLGLGLALLPGGELPAQLLLQVAARMLDGLVRTLGWLDQAGWLPVVVGYRPGWLEMAGYALVLALLARSVLAQGARGLVLWGAAFALVALPGLIGASGSGAVSLTVLDVGQGQSVLVETPQGRRYLVDGGGTFGRGFDVGRAVVARVLTRSREPRLDGVILSHADTDHLRGLLHLLERFEVGWFASSGLWTDSGDSRRARELLAARGIPERVVRDGERLMLDEGLHLDVLHPGKDAGSGDVNAESLVLRLIWDGRGLAVLPGDAEKAGLKAMAEAGTEMRADVLVLPHHGSRTGLAPRFYDAVAPRLALCAAGYLNHFRFPARQVREELKRRGVPLLSTSDLGAVHLRWKSPGGPPEIRTTLPGGPFEGSGEVEILFGEHREAGVQ